MVGTRKKLTPVFWVKLACAFSGVTEWRILSLWVRTGSEMPHYQSLGDI